ncbi:hypothetical protein ACH5RR_001723 [Cinchona calisaya]|uniref:Uncharacterized protein n=1 Tax=Cinchona calisaya TaxID=153742 RepID=A0ABD3B476_9GENT
MLEMELREIPCNHAVACIFKSRERLESYVDDFCSKETYMRNYEPSLHPVSCPGLWDKTNMPDVLLPNYGRGPGKPKKARRQHDKENNKNNFVKNMLSKKGGKAKCSYCHQYAGHNRLSCPTKVREIELEAAENQVQDGVEVPPFAGDEEATTGAVEFLLTTDDERAATAAVEVPAGGVVMRSSTTGGQAVNVEEVRGEGATKKRKCEICRKYVGHTKANCPHADPYRGELHSKYNVPPPKKAKIQSSTTTTSQVIHCCLHLHINLSHVLLMLIVFKSTIQEYLHLVLGLQFEHLHPIFLHSQKVQRWLIWAQLSLLLQHIRGRDKGVSTFHHFKLLLDIRPNQMLKLCKR